MQQPVTRQAFIEFASYDSKLRMMDTSLFLFGLKLHRQENHIEFYDSDLLNAIQVSSSAFQDRTLGDCCNMVNEALSNSGFLGNLLEVGSLREITDFDLRDALVGANKSMRVSLRFNSFEDAMQAQLLLSRYQFSLPDSSVHAVRASFFEPEPVYFDGRFSTKFEECIKDKFEGLDRINEIESDYVVRGLVERGIEPMNKFLHLLNPALAAEAQDALAKEAQDALVAETQDAIKNQDQQ